MGLHVISYGGGVQSTAMVLLAARGELPHGPYDAALLANVGNDSENPATLRFLEDVMIPWSERTGFPVHVLDRIKRDGSVETLYGRLTREGSRSLPIPIRMSNGAPGTRSCTHDFKIQVLGKWLKKHGASAENVATVAIGISTDEIQRVGNKKVMPYEQPVYPLIDLGMDRSACMRVISDEGLPVPAKSSCWFCPFHRPSVWREMRRDSPDTFQKAVDLEDLLNERRDTLGKDHVWLTRFNKRLDDAIEPAQDMLDFDPTPDIDGCDSGYCWT
jgi:hypothetical protein